MKTTAAKTKGGKTVQVLEVVESEIVDQTIEGRLHEVARLAAEQGCHSWRMRSVAGAMVAQGKAGQGLLTSAQAADRSGPDDREGY